MTIKMKDSIIIDIDNNSVVSWYVDEVTHIYTITFTDGSCFKFDVNNQAFYMLH